MATALDPRGACRLQRHLPVFEPGAGRRKVFETPEKRVEAHVPALQIALDEAYAAVRARLEETSQKARAQANASPAHRPRYLMNTLLIGACCGRPHTIQVAGKYYCRNKAQCGNRTAIARDRIEARVFAALRSLLLTPEFEARFDATLAAERRRLEGDDGKKELRELRRRRAEAQTGLNGIMRAVEQGAPYGEVLDAWSTSLETPRCSWRLMSTSRRSSGTSDYDPIPRHQMAWLPRS